MFKPKRILIDFNMIKKLNGKRLYPIVAMKYHGVKIGS